MDSDNDSYHSENEFYYPDEENVLLENKNILPTKYSTEEKNKQASGRTQDRGHSFSQYGPPGRQITYIYSTVGNILSALSVFGILRVLLI